MKWFGNGEPEQKVKVQAEEGLEDLISGDHDLFSDLMMMMMMFLS